MPDNNEAKWYIIHTFGGYEKKVKTSIENYARAQGMENIIQQVYLPIDIVVETKNGNDVTSKPANWFLFLTNERTRNKAPQTRQMAPIMTKHKAFCCLSYWRTSSWWSSRLIWESSS